MDVTTNPVEVLLTFIYSPALIIVTLMLLLLILVLA